LQLTVFLAEAVLVLGRPELLGQHGLHRDEEVERALAH
jgi:hypothetical protein